MFYSVKLSLLLLKYVTTEFTVSVYTFCQSFSENPSTELYVILLVTFIPLTLIIIIILLIIFKIKKTDKGMYLI